MRGTIAALIFVLLPALAAAQQGTSPSPPSPNSSALGPIGLPLPQIGLPLQPIGLPLSPLGLQAPPVDARPGTGHRPPGGPQTGHPKPGGKGRFRPPAIVYIGPSYWWDEGQVWHSAVPGVIAPDTPPATAPPATGRLRLELLPAEAVVQLYVDGAYVGTPEDLGSELELEPGLRRIEIRAPGYEPLVVDMRIVAGRAITYRGVLTPIERDQPAGPAGRTADQPAALAEPTAPGAGRTFYFIPGCYFGNIPPQDVPLPPDCDLSRLITRTP